jgi:hypothetical protein
MHHVKLVLTSVNCVNNCFVQDYKGMVESNGRVLGEKVCCVNYRFGCSAGLKIRMAHSAKRLVNSKR